MEFQSNMGIMNMVAQRNIVYLDRGREDGVRSGDRMELVRSGGSLPQRVVGELKILSMEDRTATALVTKSISRILKGDRFRVKARAPDIIPVSQSPQQSRIVRLQGLLLQAGSRSRMPPVKLELASVI